MNSNWQAMAGRARRFGLYAALALLAALAGPPGRADRAIVVGVQSYPKLAKGSALRGCARDAEVMQQALERYGFAVTRLVDADATKQGILDALARVKATIRPGERFVFYFAGHGDGAPKPCLLCYDAQEAATAGDLTAAELRAAVEAIPARSRTVILDSCFSGGMAKSLERLRLPGLRARYHPRDFVTYDGAKSPVVVSRRGAAGNFTAGQAGASGEGGAAVFFTASEEDQKAHEVEFNGVPEGVFTHALAARLTGAQDLLWGDVQKQVFSDVEGLLGNLQHPELAPGAFTTARVFDAPQTASGAPGASSVDVPPHSARDIVWDAYHSDHPAPDKVLMTIEPNKLTFVVGEKSCLHIDPGLDGYLVILDRDTDGKVYVAWPAARASGFNVDDAAVSAGKRVNIPADPADRKSWNYFDTAGSEHLKAILFTSKPQAAELLSAFSDNNAFVDLGAAKRLAVPSAAKSAFYTHDITYEVAPKPAAGR